VQPHRNFPTRRAFPTQGYEEIAGSLTDVRIINNGMGRELVKSVNGKMKSTTLNEVIHLTKKDASAKDRRPCGIYMWHRSFPSQRVSVVGIAFCGVPFRARAERVLRFRGQPARTITERADAATCRPPPSAAQRARSTSSRDSVQFTDLEGLEALQLLGSKNTAVWLRSDERVADDLKKALMKRSDRRPVVWMSKEVTYAPLLLMHQVWHGLVRSSVRQYTASDARYHTVCVCVCVCVSAEPYRFAPLVLCSHSQGKHGGGRLV
jgi:hypothetical protein